jgi:hypothetical protein
MDSREHPRSVAARYGTADSSRFAFMGAKFRGKFTVRGQLLAPQTSMSRGVRLLKGHRVVDAF